MNISEKIIKKTLVYEGKFINVENIEVILPNNNKATRDIIRHPGACAIMAIDSENNIIIEKQFRTALDEILLEIPAGKIDKGESPLECAKRELKEETGYVSDNFTFLTKIALAPGYSSEEIYLYLAKDIRYTKINLDDDEFLSVEKLSLKKAKEMVLSGKIKNSIAVIGILMVSDMFKK